MKNKENSMKNVGYVPVYNWGEDSKSVHGILYGATMYNDLQMLYSDETVVGHLEVIIKVVSKNKFDKGMK